MHKVLIITTMQIRNLSRRLVHGCQCLLFQRNKKNLPFFCVCVFFYNRSTSRKATFNIERTKESFCIHFSWIESFRIKWKRKRFRYMHDARAYMCAYLCFRLAMFKCHPRNVAQQKINSNCWWKDSSRWVRRANEFILNVKKKIKSRLGWFDFFAQSSFQVYNEYIYQTINCFEWENSLRLHLTWTLKPWDYSRDLPWNNEQTWRVETERKKKHTKTHRIAD